MKKTAPKARSSGRGAKSCLRRPNLSQPFSRPTARPKERIINARRAGGGHTVRDAARIVVLRPCVILQRAGKKHTNHWYQLLMAYFNGWPRKAYLLLGVRRRDGTVRIGAGRVGTGNDPLERGQGTFHVIVLQTGYAARPEMIGRVAVEVLHARERTATVRRAAGRVVIGKRRKNGREKQKPPRGKDKIKYCGLITMGCMWLYVCVFGWVYNKALEWSFLCFSCCSSVYAIRTHSGCKLRSRCARCSFQCSFYYSAFFVDVDTTNLFTAVIHCIRPVRGSLLRF